MSSRHPNGGTSAGSTATIGSAATRHTNTIGAYVSSADANYYALHHLTALPESVTKFADRTFSQSRIERALHSRMEQFTNRDSDRFRQLLRWIKNKQTVRARTTTTPNGLNESLVDEGTSGVSIIRREQFQNILEVLGVFATQDQADNLFDKYDTQGRGFLTLHELMCRASSALESDFVQGGSDLVSGKNEGLRSDDMFASRGKRQFLRQKLTGEGERPITPKQNSNLVTVPLIVKALREKLRINAPVGVTQSIPRARRDFARVFEYFDPQQLGVVTSEQLVRALHGVNFPVTIQSQKLLLDAFPSNIPPMMLRETHQGTNGGIVPSTSIYAVQTDAYNRPLQDPTTRGFDYIAFILYVLPDATPGSMTGTNGNPLSTSLYLNHDLGKVFFDNMSVEDRRKRGLPPTHEQYEAMAAAAQAAQEEKEREQQYEENQNGMNGSNRSNVNNVSNGSLSARGNVTLPSPTRPIQSQFARERAPPTPQVPSTPSETYRNISGRTPPKEWSQTLAKNPYLQSIVAQNGNGNNSARQQNGNSNIQVLQLSNPSPPQTPGAYNGSMSARTWKEQVTPRKQQQSNDDSNALNPFTSTSGSSQFIPNSAFLNPPRSSGGVIPSLSPASHRGNPLSPSRPVPSSYDGASAFTNILAAPSPMRRPQTGITTYVRGGHGRPLPPVTPRTPRN